MVSSGKAGSPSLSSRAAADLRSNPVEKARSPAPVTTATHASSSAANASQIRAISRLPSRWSAFITSGRLMVTYHTCPRCSQVLKSRSTEAKQYAPAMAVTEAPPAAKRERWTAHWAHLFDEVVTSGLCTGCAGCAVACPHDVLGYDDANGVYKPFHLEADGGPGGCGHGDRGCTSCTRACPRFRTWETEIDTFLFGRERAPEEMEGVSKDIILARATNPEVLDKGQDG